MLHPHRSLYRGEQPMNQANKISIASLAIIIFSIVMGAAHADNLTTNLTHYWKLDSNGNDTVGTLGLTPTNVTFQGTITKIINASYLATPGGSTPTTRAWLDAGNSTNWNIANDNFTIAGWWYKNASTASQGLFSSGDAFDGADFQYLIEGTDGGGTASLKFTRKGTGTSSTVWHANNLPVGSWYHVAAVYNGTTIMLYVNGTLVNSTAASGATGTHAADSRACFGAYECNYGSPPTTAKGVLNGYLDEWGFWDGKALSSGEVSALYNAGAGCGYANFTYSNTTCSAAPAITPSNFTVFANNATGGAIASYTANVTYDAQPSQVFTGTAGTAITSFYNNASVTANVTVSSTGYYNNTTLNHNTTTNLTVTLYLIPGVSNFSVQANDTRGNHLVTAFNISITPWISYQETANNTTQEGQLATGNYSFLSNYMYINYTKPQGVTSAISMSRIGQPNTKINTTLSNACFNAYSTLVSIRVFSNDTSFTSRSECWNGTAYETLNNYTNAIAGTTGNANTVNLYDESYSTRSYWNGTAWAVNTVANAGSNVWEEAIFWNALGYTTTTSQINTSIYNQNATVYNITVSAPGYITSTVTNWNVTANLTANLTPFTIITLRNSITNATITGGNITFNSTVYVTNSTGQVSINITATTFNYTAAATNFINASFTNGSGGTNFSTYLTPNPTFFSITAKDNVTTNSLTAFTATLGTLFYQETANISTSLGGLATGNYSFGNGEFFINYSKPTAVTITSATWTVKEGGVGVGAANYTVPTNCFNAYTNLISFRITSTPNSVSYAACYNGTTFQNLTDFSGGGLPAYGSTNTINLYDGDFSTASTWDGVSQWKVDGTLAAGSNIYEEGIWWNDTGVIYTTTTSQINTSINQTSGILQNVTVQANGYIPALFTNWNTSSNLTANLTPQTIVRVIDQYNNLSVAGATVTYNGTGYITNSTGQIAIDILDSNFTITIGASNYFSRTFSAQNPGNLTFSIYQAQVNFNATNLVTGGSITGFTVTTTNASNSTTPSLLYIHSGTYTFTFTKSGYLSTSVTSTIASLSNTTITFNAFDAIINVTAIDNRTNLTITTFTANASYGAFSEAAASSGNQSLLNWTVINGTNLTVTSSGYATSTSSINVTHTGTQNFSIRLNPANTVNIFIYDQSTLVLLNGTNVTVGINSLNVSMTNVTSTGNEFVYLSAGDYTFSFNATGYGTAILSLTVNGDSQTLNAYLANSGSTVDFTTLDDNTGQPIEGAFWTIQRVIGSNFTTVASLFSDISGMIQFSYVPLVQYRFNVSASGYDDLVFLLNPVIQPAYTVRLTPSGQFNSSQDYSKISLTLTPTVFYNAQLNALTMVITNPYDELTDYNLTVTYPVGGGTYNTSIATGTNASGETLIIPFTINATAVLDSVNVTYAYTSTVSGTHTFAFTYAIQNVTTTGLFTNIGSGSYGMGAFERILIVTLLTLAIVGVSAAFVGATAAGVAGLFVLGFFTATGFMPWWATAISILSGFALINAGSGR